MSGESGVAQLGVDECPPDSAVAIRKRVYRLELGVGDRRMCEGRDVGAAMNRIRSSIAAGTLSWCGGMN